MNIKKIYPMSKIIDFFVKILHLKDETKRLSSATGYKSKEEEYESWLGV